MKALVLLLVASATAFSPALRPRARHVARSRLAAEPKKEEGMDLDLGQMQDLFDAAAADGAESDAAAPQPAAEKPLPEINSGLDAVKLAATDPKEWMRAREDYDKRVAEDMILEGEGALTREDAFKYLGVLVVSFVGGRVFKQGKDDEGA